MHSSKMSSMVHSLHLHCFFVVSTQMYTAPRMVRLMMKARDTILVHVSGMVITGTFYSMGSTISSLGTLFTISLNL